MNTVIITTSGKRLIPNNDWYYSVNLQWVKYKTKEDSFRIDISARKRMVVTRQSEDEKYVSAIQSEDEITILQYNAVRGKAVCDITLNKAYSTLQNLLNAIANGDKVWDARTIFDAVTEQEFSRRKD